MQQYWLFFLSLGGKTRKNLVKNADMLYKKMFLAQKLMYFIKMLQGQKKTK